MKTGGFFNSFHLQEYRVCAWVKLATVTCVFSLFSTYFERNRFWELMWLGIYLLKMGHVTVWQLLWQRDKKQCAPGVDIWFSLEVISFGIGLVMFSYITRFIHPWSSFMKFARNFLCSLWSAISLLEISGAEKKRKASLIYWFSLGFPSRQRRRWWKWGRWSGGKGSIFYQKT